MKNPFNASRKWFHKFINLRSVYLMIKPYMRHVLDIRKVKTGNHLGVWNRLIPFTLFLMGKKDLVFEQSLLKQPSRVN